MPVLLVLASAGAWLLLGAGSMKIRRPEDTSHAIGVLVGLADARTWARILGVLETIVAIGFIALPNATTALLLGGAYLLIFATALALRTRDADCGCFGASSAQVGDAHLAITLLAAGSALVVSLQGQIAEAPGRYLLIGAGAIVALGAYAVIGPLNQLRTRLAQLRT